MHTIQSRPASASVVQYSLTDFGQVMKLIFKTEIYFLQYPSVNICLNPLNKRSICTDERSAFIPRRGILAHANAVSSVFRKKQESNDNSKSV